MGHPTLQSISVIQWLLLAAGPLPCCIYMYMQTTLLDVLSGRKTVGSLSGEIQMGPCQPTLVFLRKRTGYVEQFGQCQVSQLNLNPPLQQTHTFTHRSIC
jgi:hypothetical protein